MQRSYTELMDMWALPEPGCKASKLHRNRAIDFPGNHLPSSSHASRSTHRFVPTASLHPRIVHGPVCWSPAHLKYFGRSIGLQLTFRTAGRLYPLSITRISRFAARSVNPKSDNRNPDSQPRPVPFPADWTENAAAW